MVQSKQPIVGEHLDVRFAKLVCPADLKNGTVDLMQASSTTLAGKEGEVPAASTNADLLFKDLAKRMTSSDTEVEGAVWYLCSALFDPIGATIKDLSDLSKEQREAYAPRLRLDAFKSFWSALVEDDVDAELKSTKSAEEKALLHLTKGEVSTACETL
ncbi:hypothetical protein LTR53_018471, partial [Teratosphaeriaceae sp. CCFEE 6253]